MHRYDLSRLPQLVRRFGPVATREQLKSAGVSGPTLTAAVRADVLLRLRRGHYATPGIAFDCATAVRLGGRLGSISAARSYGWWDGGDDRIHVSWPAHGHVAKPGRMQFDSGRTELAHHWRILREPEDGRSSTWRESPQQTLAQVLLSADRLTAIACADSAIRLGTLSFFEVMAVFSVMPQRIRRWSRYVDGAIDSGLESITRVWLIDRGIPFVLHAAVDGVGEVDFLIGRSLILETDGKPGHADADGRPRDYRRDTAAASRGYIVIRLNYAQVMFDWPACERQILEHLSRGDHRRAIR